MIYLKVKICFSSEIIDLFHLVNSEADLLHHASEGNIN